jgi:serine/threonine-protein kinase
VAREAGGGEARRGLTVPSEGDPRVAAGIRPGEILAGKYQVEKVLGVGGVGVVVAARHLQLEERVALKFLLPAMAANAEAVARFAREARSAVRIKNEHVARVLDVGTLESGAPYIVMELLEGADLAQWLAQRGRMPIEQAVDFVLQACVALADAHGLGIVHRDLKPANLFCTRRSDGQLVVKVLDFGISKVIECSAHTPAGGLTRTSSVMGSPHYMSPEQAQSAKDVDTRTDIWALGVILHELLVGRVPFAGEAFGEIAVKVAVQPAPLLCTLRSDAPPALEDVIQKCLAKDRRDRFSNVADLAMALAPFAPRHAAPVVDRIAGIVRGAGDLDGDGALSFMPTPTPPATSQSIAPFGRTELASLGIGRRAPLGALLLAVLYALGALVLLVVVPRVRAASSVAGAPAHAPPSPPPGDSAAPVALAAPKAIEPGAWPAAPTRVQGARGHSRTTTKDLPDASGATSSAAAAAETAAATLAALRSTVGAPTPSSSTLPLLPEPPPAPTANPAPPEEQPPSAL